MGSAIILFGSVVGMLYVIGRKLPTLSTLSEEGYPKNIKQAVQHIQRQIRESEAVQANFTPEVVLEKTLSRVRAVALNVENKTSQWSETLKSRSAEKKDKFTKGYWNELKPEAKKKKSQKTNTST